MHVCNKMHVLIIPFLLRLLRRLQGELFCVCSKALLHFVITSVCNFCSYLRSHVCFIVELEVLKSLRKHFKIVLKYFCCRAAAAIFVQVLCQYMFLASFHFAGSAR